MRNSSPFHSCGKPKPGDALGVIEERNRRTLAEIANDRFVTHLRSCGQAYPHSEPVVRADGLTPFERAMERVRQGAGIIEVRPISRAGPQYTLGGVSPALY